MSAGLNYLAAKSIEYATTMDWLSSEFSRIPDLAMRHAHVANQINLRMAEARRRIALLETIVRLNRAALLPRGVSVVNELQLDVYVLSENYLPALKREGASEREFGRLAVKASRRCGLIDIKDIVISLTSGHAVLPAMLSCPLLFAPPHQRHTLIDLAAIYHEFGHLVFQARREIRDRLTSVPTSHFQTLERAAGFLNPGEREERRKELNEATEYWTVHRLDEIFCDIFATYATGPAHFYSSVDMAIRYADDPYKIDLTDEHPPMAARVATCRKSLSTDQLNSRIGQGASALWDEHVRYKRSARQFSLWCADELLEKIASESIDAISGSGAFRQYLGSGRHPELEPAADINLEELLNESIRMFLYSPAEYPAWERPFVEALFQL
jgi:hypothetical protein